MFSSSRMSRRRGRPIYSRSRSSRTRRSGFGNFNSVRRTRIGGRSRAGVRFATSGYRRDIEKKYLDRALVATYDVQNVGFAGGSAANGIMFRGTGWAPMNFGGLTPAQGGVLPSGDLLKGLETGTTIETRIGNRISPRYLKGSITMTAAMHTVPKGNTEGNQHGESVVTHPQATEDGKFIRTTYRVAIVKDMQVNSVDKNITWGQVFGRGKNNIAPNDDYNGVADGVHAELNLDNMGRFIVLFDKTFNVDADDPQVTCPFMISGSSIGEVRYNGPGAIAETDKGIYVIWAAYCTAVTRDVSGGQYAVGMGGPAMNSRLCFIDR